MNRARDKNDIDNFLYFLGKRTYWRQIYRLSIDDIRFHPGLRQEKSHGKIPKSLHMFYNLKILFYPNEIINLNKLKSKIPILMSFTVSIMK